jgi:hypothetical protein
MCVVSIESKLERLGSSTQKLRWYTRLSFPLYILLIMLWSSLAYKELEQRLNNYHRTQMG